MSGINNQGVAHRLQTGLDAETLKRVRIAAAHAGVTLNDAVRRAILEYVECSESQHSKPG